MAHCIVPHMGWGKMASLRDVERRGRGSAPVAAIAGRSLGQLTCWALARLVHSAQTAPHLGYVELCRSQTGAPTSRAELALPLRPSSLRGAVFAAYTLSPSKYRHLRSVRRQSVYARLVDMIENLEAVRAHA
jgi:hypothetical protein